MDYQLKANIEPTIADPDEATVEITPSSALLREAGGDGAATAASRLSSELRSRISQVSLRGRLAPRQEIGVSIRIQNGPHAVNNLTLRSRTPTETIYLARSTKIDGVPVADPPEGGLPLSLDNGLALGPLAPNQEVEITFTCRATRGLRNGTLVPYSAELLAGRNVIARHGCYALSRSTPDGAVLSSCELSAEPTGTVKPGDYISYRFSVSNLGTATATGVQLSALPPESVSYVPGSTRWENLILADQDGTSPLFSADGSFVGTLEPGKAQSASFQVRVARPLDDGTSLLCRGQVFSNETRTLSLPPIGHAVEAAPSFADLGLNWVHWESGDANSVVPGEAMSFAVQFANTGHANAYDCRLAVPLPSHLEYVPGSLDFEGVNLEDDVVAARHLFSDHGYLLGTVETAASDQPALLSLVQFKARLADHIPNGTTLDIPAFMRGTNFDETEFGAVHIDVKSAPHFDPERTHVEVEPSGDISPGTELTFTIEWFNDGNAPALNAVLRAGLPFEASVMPHSTQLDGEAMPDVEGASALFSLDGMRLAEVPAGSGGMVSFKARVATPLDAGTIIASRVALNCDELDTVSLKPVSVRIVSAPDFSGPGNRLDVSSGSDGARGSGDLFPRPGETLFYTIYFQNDGDADAKDVVLRSLASSEVDPLPQSTTLQQGASMQVAEDIENQPPLFSHHGLRLGRVAAGTGGKVTYAVRLRRPLVNGVRLMHKSTITSTQLDTVELMAPAIAVSAEPVFSETNGTGVDVTPVGDIIPGQKLTYTVRILNSGGAVATGIWLQVVAPEQCAVLPDSVSISWPVAERSNLLHTLRGRDLGDGGRELFSQAGCRLGELATDANGIVKFDVVVNKPLDGGTMLKCQAFIGCTELFGSETYEVESRVKASADFSITDYNFMLASPADRIAPNDVIRYSIHYKNTGLARAYRLAARVRLSEYVLYMPNSTTLNGRHVPDVDAQTPLTSPSGLFMGPEDADIAGEISFSVRVRSQIEPHTEVLSQAQLEVGKRRGLLKAEDPLKYDFAEVKHAVVSFAAFNNAELNFLTVMPPSEVRPGEVLHYVAHYHNTGSWPGKEVALRAILAPISDFVPESVRVNGQRLTAETGAQLLSMNGLSIGHVALDEGGTVEFDARMRLPLENGLKVPVEMQIICPSAAATQLLHAENEVRSSVDFSTAAGNVLTPRADEVIAGETMTYRLEFANQGDANATATRIYFRLGNAELTYVPHASLLNGRPLPEPSDTLLSEGVLIGEVATGGRGELSFSVRIGERTTAGTQLAMAAEIRCDQTAAGTIIEAAPLVVRAPSDFSRHDQNYLEVYPEGDIAADQKPTFTLHYVNHGEGEANNVTLRAKLPDNTVYLAGRTYLNGELVPDIDYVSPLFHETGLLVGTVEPGEIGDVVFQARVAPALMSGTSVVGQAWVGVGKRLYEVGGTRNTIRSLVDFGEPDGLVLDVAPLGDIERNSFITYTIQYKNRGTAPATQVVLGAVLPQHTTYVARSTRLNGLPLKDTDDTSQLFTKRGVMLARVLPGEWGRVTVRLQVDEEAPLGSWIPFQVNIHSLQAPPLSSNQTVNRVVLVAMPAEAAAPEPEPVAAPVSEPAPAPTPAAKAPERASAPPAKAPELTPAPAPTAAAKAPEPAPAPALAPAPAPPPAKAPEPAPAAAAKTPEPAPAPATAPAAKTPEPAPAPASAPAARTPEPAPAPAPAPAAKTPEPAPAPAPAAKTPEPAPAPAAKAAAPASEPSEAPQAPEPAPAPAPAARPLEPAPAPEAARAPEPAPAAEARAATAAPAPAPPATVPEPAPAPAAKTPTPAPAAAPTPPSRRQQAQVYSDRAARNEGLGLYLLALQDYEEAIKLDSDNPTYFINRGLAFTKLGRYANAIQDYGEAIRLVSSQEQADDADDDMGFEGPAMMLAQLHLDRGLIALKMGRTESAATDFKLALVLDPNLTAEIPPGPWLETSES